MFAVVCILAPGGRFKIGLIPDRIGLGEERGVIVILGLFLKGCMPLVNFMFPLFITPKITNTINTRILRGEYT